MPQSARADILSGLTVALALVPEAIAFAFVAGVPPLVGLYSAFFMGLITAVFGGRPGMISGATGAMAVVVVALVAMHGITYLFPAVILCGLIQITIGFLRLGKLIRMVPHSVMLGFVNGLAIVIGLAQIGSFKKMGEDGLMHFIGGSQMVVMVLLMLLTMGIIFFLPKFTKVVPSTLVAIVVVTLISIGVNRAGGIGGQPVLTVKDMLVTGNQSAAVTALAKDEAQVKTDKARALLDDAKLAGPGIHLSEKVVLDSHDMAHAIHALDSEKVSSAIQSVNPDEVSLEGGLPKIYFFDAVYKGFLPPMNMATLLIILPFALVLCGVGLIESLMTLSLIDEITETRGRGNRECIGQGLANVTSGLFGGMGGCAMIGQSLINVKSGGKGRLSGITAAVCLLLFILVLAPLTEMIPMAALVGVMFMVVIGTFEWTSLRTFRKLPRGDVFVMIFVATYTVLMHDLASAVILGVVISALVFAWKKSTQLVAQMQVNEAGSKIYQLHGPLFFASVGSFRDLFDPQNDPEDVVIDFYYTRVHDQSGLEAINALAERYAALDKRLHLRHLSDECQKLLDKADDLVEANISEDPHYHIATDLLG